MKVTINNAFHNTSKNVRLKSGINVIRGRRLREWKRALCGNTGCGCSGLGGLRSGQYVSAVMGVDIERFENAYDYEKGEEYLIIYIKKS